MFIKKLDKTVVSPDVVNYYVDHVNGNDGHSGDSTHPLKTIDHALRLIKGDPIHHIDPQPVENHVYNIKIIGDYITDSPIEFNGIAHKINIVSNDDSNKSNIIVGEEIASYTQSGGVVSFTTSNYPSSVIINGQVIEMNKSCDLHYPTEIYVPEETVTLIQGSQNTHLQDNKLYLKVKKPTGLNIEPNGNEIFMYYMTWKAFSSTIAYYDDDNGYFYVECPSKSGASGRVPYWGDFPVSDITFRILNNEIYLGGFYFTKSGSTYTVHVPFDGTVNSIAVPTAFENVKIKNCYGLSLSNVKFTGSKFRTINTLQAGANTYGSIMVEDSAGITIEGCEFEGTYGYSVMISNNCQGCHVKDNYFHDLFGGAVHVSSANQSLRHNDAFDENAYEKSGNDDSIKPNCTYITDNLIKGFGRIDSNCCGILVRFSKDNYIEHNTICDGFYSGIDAGYTFGYATQSTEHNHIAYNHIHHCMQFVTSDGGGIYLLGQQKGTIVEYNKVHDIYSKATKQNANGIYLDQASSDLIVRYNLVYSCDRSFMLHYGKCNRLFNNLLAYSLHEAVLLNSTYMESDNYNLLSLLSNMLIEDAEKGDIRIGKASVYVNTITNSDPIYKKLAGTHTPVGIQTPNFEDIGNGDFSFTYPIGSDKTEGVYKFYRGFLIETEEDTSTTPATIKRKDTAPGVTSQYLRGIEPITDRYVIGGRSENYDNYYRKLTMSLTGKVNAYLLSVASDPV